MFVANSHLDNSLSFLKSDYMSLFKVKFQQIFVYPVSTNTPTLRLCYKIKWNKNFKSTLYTIDHAILIGLQYSTIFWKNRNQLLLLVLQIRKNLVKDTFLISSGTETISSAFSFFSGVDWWLEEKSVKSKLNKMQINNNKY